MTTAQAGLVLVPDHHPQPTNPWSGLTFPGGHVEQGETVGASVTREVREKVELTVYDLRSRVATRSQFEAALYHMI